MQKEGCDLLLTVKEFEEDRLATGGREAGNFGETFAFSSFSLSMVFYGSLPFGTTSNFVSMSAPVGKHTIRLFI